MNNTIDKALGIVEEVSTDNKKQEVMPLSQEDWGDANTEHVERDYEYQRQNFYNLVERGTDEVEGILEIATESDHRRA